MKDIIYYIGLNGFLVWFIQSQKIFDKIKISIFQEIRQCKLCLGTWISILLFPYFAISLLSKRNWLDRIITGSFIVLIWHIIYAGWKSLYSITIIK